MKLRTIPFLLPVLLATVLARPPQPADEAEEAPPTDALALTVTVPADFETFAGAGVWVRLWEYDPFLADAAADLFAEIKQPDLAHTAGKETKYDFKLGDKGKARADRQYYVTVYFYRDGKIGDNTQRLAFVDGFNKVTIPGALTRPVKKL